MNSKKIQTAFISVFNKEGLENILNKLNEQGVEIYSTGGTQKFIEDLGIKVIPVEEITSYPSILGGRVKTLHPKIFGGILNRRNNELDKEEVLKYAIPSFDLVCVDLYPFQETLASNCTESELIEKIDIGGVSLIRAAAKNFNDVFCLCNKGDYNSFYEILCKSGGDTTLEERRYFATKAFKITSQYDTAIYEYFEDVEPIEKNPIHLPQNSLRYGENPHQKGIFLGHLGEILKQLHGKEISYNNLLDIDTAINVISEFVEEKPTFAILKHNNCCGIATRDTLKSAYENALECDPVSAFGGVLVTNKTIDLETATKINELFCEVVIAPNYDEESLAVLKQKKNRILLVLNKIPTNSQHIRTCLNGYLLQEKDYKTDSETDFEIVTNKNPQKEQIEDLIFASKVCKHTKSNAIVLAKDKKLVGIGTGQTSRIDALNHAIEKAKNVNFSLKEAVMASDAFFPFPDCIEVAYNEGVKNVIQPGGSIKDSLSIDFCNEKNIAMIFTKIRHFKH